VKVPLTLNSDQLWERIKKVEGQQFSLIQTRELFRVDEVANERVTTKNVQTGKTCKLSRKNVTFIYEYVKKEGKCTRDVYPEEKIKFMRLAQIIALLALAVPEEIESFTQDEGERLFGKKLRGIRKKDC
jgi:hypothetical protein